MNAPHDTPRTDERVVWGGGCECWVTPEQTWTTYASAVEPGSQVEFNPECPEHGERTDERAGLSEADCTCRPLDGHEAPDSRGCERHSLLGLLDRLAAAVARAEAAEAERDDLRERVLDGMTVPPGGPEYPFWRGAQWAYGQVRAALAPTTGDEGAR